MTKHIWAAPSLPLWYVLDNIEEWFETALGPDCYSKSITIDNLEFQDSTGKRYPMSKVYYREVMVVGTFWKLLRDAQREGVHAVGMSLDVHIMEAK